jgi:hypothetical protein
MFARLQNVFANDYEPNITVIPSKANSIDQLLAIKNPSAMGYGMRPPYSHLSNPSSEKIDTPPYSPTKQEALEQWNQLPVTSIQPQRFPGYDDVLSMALTPSVNLPRPRPDSLYHRHISSPFPTDVKQGGTINTVMKEVRPLPANTPRSVSRVEYIQGAIKKYDICNEYPDSASPPFSLRCLQQIFLSMGGQEKGTMYPTESNLTFYNMKGNVGAVRQYIQTLVTKRGDHAMKMLLGITSDDLVTRAPYTQGVEVFWFLPTPGVLKQGGFVPISGFLKRTIESKMIAMNDESQTRLSRCIVQLTDVRTPEDFKTTFQVIFHNGFILTVNQPAHDKHTFTRGEADEPGLLQCVGYQRPITYTSEHPCTFHRSLPNIMKIYTEDTGNNTIKIRPLDATAQKMLTSAHLSLTCERMAPFLTFEVNDLGEFQELRHPDMFSQFCTYTNLTPFHRTDDRSKVPGKKGFVRLNSSSYLSLRSIAFQSWRTMTFAVRFTTMPVKATFFHIASGLGPYCSMIAIPAGNGQMKMQFEYRGLDGVHRQTGPEWRFGLNAWFLFTITNIGSGFQIKAQSIAQWIDAVSLGSDKIIDLTSGIRYTFYDTQETANPEQIITCDISFGLNPGSMYVDSHFHYDIAWVHFFEHVASDGDLKRDASCDWIYTPFPRK